MISVTVFLVGVIGLLPWPLQKGFRVTKACYENARRNTTEIREKPNTSMKHWIGQCEVHFFIWSVTHTLSFYNIFFCQKKGRLNGITKTPYMHGRQWNIFSFPLKIFLNTHPCPNPNEYSSPPSNPFPNTRSSSCRVFYLAAGASLWRGGEAAGKIL